MAKATNVRWMLSHDLEPDEWAQVIHEDHGLVNITDVFSVDMLNALAKLEPTDWLIPYVNKDEVELHDDGRWYPKTPSLV